MQFDFYHVQIVGGDIVDRFEKFLPRDRPSAMRRGAARATSRTSGEVNYPYVFAEVDRLGYAGWIGAEYRPRFGTEAGLGWAKPYGVVPR